MSQNIQVKETVRDLTKYRELKSFSVYVNLFSQTQTDGITRSIFKITVEDSISHHKFIGYSLDKSKSSIDIFVNYVISNLEKRNMIDKQFLLSKGNQIHGTEIIPYSPPDRKKGKSTVIRQRMDHREIISSLYKEMIFNEGRAVIEGYSETDNPIIPPLFVDSLIKDIEKVVKFTDFWRDFKIPDEDNMILKETLMRSGIEADRYIEKFDFKNALKLYNRLYTASSELNDSDALTAGFILKQAKIYFHLEQYDKCRSVLEKALDTFDRKKIGPAAGELYYYLGMIFVYSNRIREADNYLARSSRLLSNSSDREKKNIYFRSRIRRFIIKGNYNQATVLANRAIRKAFGNNDLKELSYLYGVRSEICYREGRYEAAMENAGLQLNNAVEAKDTVAEAKACAQIFLIYAYWDNASETKIKEYLKKIKVLSKTIRKRSYYYDALINLGIHYFKKDDYKKSEPYFNRACRIYTSDTKDAGSHIVNMIYLSKIKTEKKNYLGSVRLLNRMLKLSTAANVKTYPAYIENSLGRIYHEKSQFTESNKHMRKALAHIKEFSLNDSLLKAHTYRLMGLNYLSTGMKNKAFSYLSISRGFYNKLMPEKNEWAADALKEIEKILQDKHS